MATFNVSDKVGEDYGRSLKKALFTFAMWVAAYTLISGVLFTIMLVRWFTDAGAELFGGDMPRPTRALYAFIVSQMPWILWIFGRAWYKYVHATREARRLKSETEAWNRNLNFEGLKALLGIETRITRNDGTYFRDEDSFQKSITEKDAERLRDWEG